MRPLRPATDHRLGGPLPRQLANQPRPPLQANCSFNLSALCGISPGFPRLSPTRRQVSHVLLTRSPLYSGIAPLSRLKPEGQSPVASHPSLAKAEDPRPRLGTVQFCEYART